MKIDWKHIGIKQLAAVIFGKLNENGIDAILVGDACVSIYTKNKYLSRGGEYEENHIARFVGSMRYIMRHA